MIETFDDARPALASPHPKAPASQVWRSVTLIVCTRRHPHGLLRAVRSAFAQRGAGLALQVVAVDADPAGAALPLMRTLEAEAPCPFVWTHAPCADGLGEARAAGLSKATGDLVAFLDDVHDPEPGWLAALTAALRAEAADAAFGPIEARVPDGVLLGRGLIAALAARVTPRGRGPGADLLDLAGGVFVRVRMFSGRGASAVVLDQPDALLARAQAAGARLAWAETARLRIHVPYDEARLGAAAAKAFREGARRRVALAAAGAAPTDLARLRRAAALKALQLAPLTVGAWLLLSARRDALLARLCRTAGLAWAAAARPRDEARSPAWVAWTGGRRLARVPAI